MTKTKWVTLLLGIAVALYFSLRVFMLPVLVMLFTHAPLSGCYSSETLVDDTEFKTKRCFSFMGSIDVITVVTNKQKLDEDIFVSYTLIPKRIDVRNSVAEYSITNAHMSPEVETIESKWKSIGDIQIKIDPLENHALEYKSQLLNGKNGYEVLLPW
ncbi:hypothetical protein [Endozoicomonas arenosclerae]|uniref:hypothetical protein n=1 Tax=Endozoicomonas arenosclerae TaxID=1633495 RepID=UPI0007821C69|nr:hypothetical protein [Endozoicomonas arenosclerae]